MAIKASARRRIYAKTLNPIVPATTDTFELTDSSTRRFAADFLLGGALSRDPSRQTARLVDQFLEQNRSRFRILGLEVRSRYDGAQVELLVEAGIKIGAIPLLSPTSGKSNYGFVVRPRFAWTGIGDILGATGWRIIPTPLSLPLLPRSERNIPPWVLSTIIIARVEALLKGLERKFELVSEERRAPRGRVDWPDYARRQVSRAQLLNVPCRFPDLRQDRELKAAIRFTLEKQIAGLQGQLASGLFVFKLIAMCQQMMEAVRDVAPRAPTPATIQGWLSGRLAPTAFRDGIQAIEWTTYERGLAGLSDLQGLAWVMSMDEFFESWAETILVGVSHRIGGTVRTQRQRQTVTPLSWSPPYLRSQKTLVPDLVLEREDQTIIIDAKYKQHWEEMQDHRWLNLEEEIRERHRSDLLQVLAYANLSTTKRTTVCLAYPCLEETWKSLRARNLSFHRASVGAGTRRVDLMLTAFPMSTRVLPDVVDSIALAIRQDSN